MLVSMTGFGSAKVKWGDTTILLEIRSLNHRFRSFSFKMPHWLYSLESDLTSLFDAEFRRGRFEVTLHVSGEDFTGVRVQVNAELVKQYYSAIGHVVELTGLSGEIALSDLLSCQDIFIIENKESDAEVLWPPVEEVARLSMEALQRSRIAEGSRIALKLYSSLSKLEGLLSDIVKLEPILSDQYRDRLRVRVSDLLGETHTISQERLEQEVILYAERSSVTEEINRLEGHLQQFKLTMEKSSPIGRTLDFLLQEIHREVNTLGMKLTDGAVSIIIVEFKTELEKIREQVQNVE